MIHVGPAIGTSIRDGLYLRRGALPRAPDRVQVLEGEVRDALPLREQVLALFTPSARRLAR